MAEKSFNVRSKELGLNGVPNSARLIKDYLANRRIKIIKQTSGHNYGPNGTIHTLPEIITGGLSGGSGNIYTNIGNLIPGKNNLSFTAFTVIEKITEEELKEDIKRFKNKQKELRDLIRDEEDKIKQTRLKIQFIKDQNLEEFDAEQFKSYQALSLLEDETLSKIEKSRILADLIRG